MTLKEVNQQFLDGGMGRIRSNLESSVKKGKLSKEGAEAVLGRVRGTLEYAGFEALDMVIEAVIEDLPLKQRIFADLERACGPNCILSTNTSTIDITRVAANVRAKERMVGAHFFSPAHVMPLFEIVRTPQTAPQVLVDTLALSKLIKKTPVVARTPFTHAHTQPACPPTFSRHTPTRVHACRALR